MLCFQTVDTYNTRTFLQLLRVYWLWYVSFYTRNTSEKLVLGQRLIKNHLDVRESSRLAHVIYYADIYLPRVIAMIFWQPRLLLCTLLSLGDTSHSVPKVDVPVFNRVLENVGIRWPAIWGGGGTWITLEKLVWRKFQKGSTTRNLFLLPPIYKLYSHQVKQMYRLNIMHARAMLRYTFVHCDFSLRHN